MTETHRKSQAVTAALIMALAGFAVQASGQTLYDSGNPSAEEQWYLEWINRARANPAAEGARLAATTDPEVLAAYTQYGVNLTMMQSEFNAIASAPPIAPNAKLMGTARNHSAWMLANAVQSHDEGGVDPFGRMTNAGYNWSSASENVYAYSRSLFFGHASFQVDWGSGTGGMQTGRGHRVNIHSANYREVGVGMAFGNNGGVGPQLVTQDFGTQQGSPHFGTGVAYYDLNSNNFYDVGEGISGLTVNVSGASYYCTTAQGGGWTTPIPSTAATRTVSFTGLNVNQSVNMTVPATSNAKADLKLVYSPPTITSGSTTPAGSPYTVAFNAIGGATSYKWNRWQKTNAPAENCENAAGVTSFTTGSYSLVSSTTKQQGAASFHLAHPTTADQWIELNGLYFGGTSPSISFQSRLGYAAPGQHAKVQIKEEGGSWVDLYDQAGTNGAGESVFNLRTANITGMTGKAFRVRFFYDYQGGSYFPQTTDDAGWLIDAISFANTSVLTNNSLDTLATNSGAFTPAATGEYLMSIVPVISGRDFPATYQNLTVTTSVSNISIATSPATVTEDGATNLVYTFTRTAPTTSAVTANFTVGGTATLTTDYTQTGAATFTSTTGTVTFAAGATTATVTLNPAADTTVEPDETAILTLAAGTGYAVGTPSSATGTISNDDTSVSLALSPASVTEDGSSTLIHTFTRSGLSTGALTVNFTVGGTATPTTDYTQTGAATFTSSAGTVTFAAGATTATVTLDPVADTTVEPNETTILTLAAGTGYGVGTPSSATGTISNDDTSVSLALSPATVTEDGSSTLIHTFTRSGLSTGALTVNFTVGGTATPTTDYTQTGAATFTSTAGTVTFAAGATTATVTLDPVADTTVEPDETTILTLATGTGYTVGTPNSATGTISNDDASVSLAVSPATVTEDGTTNPVYTFTRSGFTANPLTVNFTVGGTATFTTDHTQTGAASFSSNSGTVTFAAGASTATVTLDPVADTIVEPDETTILTLGTGTGYTIGTPNTATGTVTNDDTNVNVTASPASVLENGTTGIVYTFTRSGINTSALTINFTVGGTATFNTDYTQTGATTFASSSGTLSLAAGATSKTITISTKKDTIEEADETVILAVTTGTGYTPGTSASATGTITNDDAGVTVAVSPSNVSENGTTGLTYTFTRTGVLTNSLTSNFSVSGTATFNTDYTQSGAASYNSSTGTVTFPAGSATKTVVLTPKDDTSLESNETATLTVTSGTGYSIGATPAATGTITDDDSLPPTIVSQPASTVVPYGTSTTLSVSVQASSPTYEWLKVNPDGSTNVVATGSPTYTTPQLATTEMYKVKVSNAAGSTESNTAVVRIRHNYLTWATDLEIARGLPPGTLTNNPNGDQDRDGRSNLIEFAFGASPVNANDAAPGMPVFSRSSTHLFIRYQRDTLHDGIAIIPQMSAGMDLWKTPGSTGTPADFSDSLLSVSSDGTIETREVRLPVSAGPRLFLRMQVTQQ